MEKSFHLVVLAGGIGSRMENSFPGVPKPLININNKPLMLNSLSTFIKEINIEKVIYRVAYNADIFARYFNDGLLDLDVPTSMVIGKIKDGPIGAMIDMINMLDAENLVFIAGDTFFFKNDFCSAKDFHSKNYSGMTVTVAHTVPSKEPSTLVIDQNNILSNYSRKPLTNSDDLINAGLYFVNRSKVTWLLEDYRDWKDYQNNQKQYKEDNLWKLIINKPQRALIYKLTGKIVNINSISEFEYASNIISNDIYI